MSDAKDKVQTEKKKPRGKPFGPDNPGKPGPGRGYHKVAPPTPEGLVADFDYVYRNAEGENETPGQQYARKVLKKSYEKFVDVYNRLLKAAEVAEKKKPQTADTVNVASTVVDVGEQEEGVERLIEQLILELGGARDEELR